MAIQKRSSRQLKRDTMIRANQSDSIAKTKKSLDPIPYELKDFKKLERVLISNTILFKNTTIMYGKS